MFKAKIAYGFTVNRPVQEKDDFNTKLKKILEESQKMKEKLKRKLDELAEKMDRQTETSPPIDVTPLAAVLDLEEEEEEVQELSREPPPIPPADVLHDPDAVLKFDDKILNWIDCPLGWVTWVDPRN
ncbi:hypothetical protein SUGI_0928610 [Cryptomeria japonica]|nr:hypothetical protein SUGI_0928610 [Cryptomeria japonica]